MSKKNRKHKPSKNQSAASNAAMPAAEAALDNEKNEGIAQQSQQEVSSEGLVENSVENEVENKVENQIENIVENGTAPKAEETNMDHTAQVTKDDAVSISDDKAAGEIPPAAPGGALLVEEEILPPKKSFRLKFSEAFRKVTYVAAIIIFIGSLLYLGKIGISYLQSTMEYSSLQEDFISKETLPSSDDTPEPTTAPKEQTEEQPLTQTEESTTEEPETTTINPELLALDYEPFSVNFDELKKFNTDVVAWIDIPGIDISYPVVLGEDNDYYLRHTFKKMYNVSGSIYLDMKSSGEFTERNTLIYGHNQDNGKMFSNLHMLKNPETAAAHDLIVIYLPEKTLYYKIFSVRVCPYSGKSYRTQFASDEDYAEYLATATAESMNSYNRSLDASTAQIISLVTCTDNSEYRLVVQAELLK